eukprot:CAMPEP_0119011640 /NCGR_PEP_ID=MMETSP1176-20130426/5801_1 /TAXON_ID=265551 /ORGANISM="Synedropsis recta cf, Strain CCMP1620" /LENGTH=99 /DNA_ID=CAMNT_0006964495 /DNA_START=104 /DNA_END=403 /DNA_ORIENTATION=-
MTAHATPQHQKKRVSFRPYVEIAVIPPVDPETKHLMYYSKCELFLIEVEVKRQILMLRNMMEEKKKGKQEQKRPITPPTPDRPMKRMRTTSAPPVVPAV